MANDPSWWTQLLERISNALVGVTNLKASVVTVEGDPDLPATRTVRTRVNLAPWGYWLLETDAGQQLEYPADTFHRFSSDLGDGVPARPDGWDLIGRLPWERINLYVLQSLHPTDDKGPASVDLAQRSCQQVRLRSRDSAAPPDELDVTVDIETGLVLAWQAVGHAVGSRVEVIGFNETVDAVTMVT